MAIYDCFTFYNEIELLEWRLRMLYDTVDYFVIVEGNRTFQNREKPFYLDAAQERLAPYRDKVRRVKITEPMPYTSDWSIEIFQRDAIGRGLSDCRPDDLILVSDVDELPDPRLLRSLRDVPVRLFRCFGTVSERQGLRGLSRNGRCLLKSLPHWRRRQSLAAFLDAAPVVMEQRMFEFFVNYERPTHWCGTILCRARHFGGAQALRQRRNRLPLVQGGWHFSSLGGVAAIKKKLAATSDGKKNPVLALPAGEQDAFIARELERGRIWWRGESLLRRDTSALDIPHIGWFVRQYPQMQRAEGGTP